MEFAPGVVLINDLVINVVPLVLKIGLGHRSSRSFHIFFLIIVFHLVAVAERGRRLPFLLVRSHLIREGGLGGGLASLVIAPVAFMERQLEAALRVAS